MEIHSVLRYVFHLSECAGALWSRPILLLASFVSFCFVPIRFDSNNGINSIAVTKTNVKQTKWKKNRLNNSLIYHLDRIVRNGLVWFSLVIHITLNRCCLHISLRFSFMSLCLINPFIRNELFQNTICNWFKLSFFSTSLHFIDV